MKIINSSPDFTDPSIPGTSNINEFSDYPFEESSSMVDNNNKVLPMGFLSDAHIICISSGYNNTDSKIALTRAHVGPSIISVSFSLYSLIGVEYKFIKDILVATTYRNSFKPFCPVICTSVDGMSSGVVSFGQIDSVFKDFYDIDKKAISYDFLTNTFDDTNKLSTVIDKFCSVIYDIKTFAPDGFTECIVDDTTGESVTGDVKIITNGLHASIGEQDNSDLNHINIDLTYDINISKILEEKHVNYITSINGIKPDSNGTIRVKFTNDKSRNRT